MLCLICTIFIAADVVILYADFRNFQLICLLIIRQYNELICIAAYA